MTDDRFVAWRRLCGAADPTGELARALSQILGRSFHAAVDRSDAEALFPEVT